ncbi:MAG: prepilin-type N-terminal cleavage/methylation domain-containing protein [Candidatus Eremiobacterota bacterium]
MSTRRAGFSLPELIVAMFILGMLLGILFVVFNMGSRSFQGLVVRQGIQSEARRVSALLRKDLTATHFNGTSVLDRIDGAGQERDALSIPTVNNWSDPGNFDQFQKPQWNRYLVYYATVDDTEKNPPLGDPNRGQLFRKQIDPGATMVFPLPYGNLGGALSSPTAPAGDFETFKLLTSNVESFAAEKSLADEMVRVRLVLRQPTRSPGQSQEVEKFEIFVEMHPENTWPSL